MNAAVSPQPYYEPPPAIDRVIEEHAEEVWDLVQDPKTYVLLAGLVDVENAFLQRDLGSGGFGETVETDAGISSLKVATPSCCMIRR